MSYLRRHRWTPSDASAPQGNVPELYGLTAPDVDHRVDWPNWQGCELGWQRVPAPAFANDYVAH